MALKLTYFDFPGRAELARLLFAFGGVAYEDVRLSNPEFGAIKASLPFGQVPTLETDGVVFAQSMAIHRYAAKVAGLYPADPVQALRMEMISETLLELVGGAMEIKYMSDEVVKAEKTTKYLNEIAPRLLAVLDKMVQGKFFLGDNATMADVQLLHAMLNGLKANFPNFDCSKYPQLESVVEAVKSNANITAYLAKA
uniref:Glutathione S-transferase n=1 Tax=Globisporangium ultimum (strain ATCC 200006 / CBS 805.95 / DAOM BR144) TaxID=431595 RepID=K3WK06_GLOUD